MRAEPAWATESAERSLAQQRVRGVERAQHIVAATRRLVVRRGADFTVQELAREARIALPTFYRHFPSKDLVLVAVIDDMIRERCDELRVRVQGVGDPLDRLRLHVEGALMSDSSAAGWAPSVVASEHYRLLRLYPEQMTRAMTAFTDLLVPEIEAAVGLGRLTNPEPAHAAWFVTQLLIGAFHRAHFVGGDATPELLGDRLWTFVCCGLGAPVRA